ncbi:MAG: hypothetical protein HY000_24245 [Planctomycetes bacterium]|nr:hypothetical protein [Planctomycetota bacterium]
MTQQLFLVAVVALSAAPLAAEEGLVPVVGEARPQSASSTVDEPPIAAAQREDRAAANTKQNPYVIALGSGCAGSSDVCCDACFLPSVAVRFGWWATSIDGSKNKTGEFQDLSPSPFWDVDALLSDGLRTFDFTLSGLDDEANDARLQYYSPDVSAKVKYDRYLRRLDHDPLTGTPVPPGAPYPPGPGFALPAAAGNVRSQDLNVGEDYAIRVEEFDAKFQGRLTDNLKWRLNLWGMEKFGERQVNVTAHCFNTNVPAAAGANGNTCHVLSQRQSIDWLTMELQPAVEARFGPVTLEYSRTMRSFSQNDQLVNRTYTRFGFNLPAASGFEGPQYDYAIVPDSFTQIDRLKVGATLTECTQFYANLYHGDTENDFRETRREFSGFDLRLTNRSIDGLTLTSYASMDDENNQFPPFLFKSPPFGGGPTAFPGQFEPGSLGHPVDRTRMRAGVKGNWRPFSNTWSSECGCDPWSGLSLEGGYEFYRLSRDFATYETALGPFTQQDTISQQIEFGPSMRWSQSLDTRVRYVGRFIEDPLIGVREHNGAFNTNQPEQEHGVEIGGAWAPASNFLATTQFGIVNRFNDSQFADFTENDYPIVCTAWYAPCERLSLSGGYAFNSNWIDQDITLGFTVPGVPVPPLRTETTRWSYGGTNHLFNVGASFAWTPCLHLVGGYEWDRGSDVFSVPASPAGADWSLLPSLSDVVVKTQRLTAGVDWKPYHNMGVYFRYVYFDYEDISAGLDSGTAHMFLGGLTAAW